MAQDTFIYAPIEAWCKKYDCVACGLGLGANFWATKKSHQHLKPNDFVFEAKCIMACMFVQAFAWHDLLVIFQLLYRAYDVVHILIAWHFDIYICESWIHCVVVTGSVPTDIILREVIHVTCAIRALWSSMAFNIETHCRKWNSVICIWLGKRILQLFLISCTVLAIVRYIQRCVKRIVGSGIFALDYMHPQS